MKSIIIWLEIFGLLLGLIALVQPSALSIMIFLSLGNVSIFVGLLFYLIIIVKDLKRHKVL